MYIYDPVANFIQGLVLSRQTYRCLVDGMGEFRGEALPIGTKAQVLSWIKARYKVIGELIFIDMKFQEHNIIFCYCPLSPHSEAWQPRAPIIRYLVDVDGVEKVFILRPFPAAYLEWRPCRLLTMS